MQKTKILSLLALGILSILLVSTVSAASIWEPQYETYRLGGSKYNSGYSSSSTYEKVKIENEDRFGSESSVTIRKTESETYTPARVSTRNRYYDYDRYDHGYRYNDRYGYGRTIVKNNDVFIYNDGVAYPSTNWRYKEVYHDYDYPNENYYGYDYYYSPRYDWHRGIYNWRY